MEFYEQPFTIRYSELNRHGYLKDEAFFDIFQEVASRHAELLGCGFGTMQELTWVLSKIRIQVLRAPQQGQTIMVRTWPTGFNRLYAVRQALFFDAQGDLAKITSYWLLIDWKTMRPQRLPDALPCPIPENAGLPHYFDLNSRNLPNTGKMPLETRVAEHEIDVNQHLNNARYCSRISDWLAYTTGQTPRITDISASFLHGTQVNTILTTHGEIDDQGHFQARIFSREPDGSDLVRFVAYGTFAKENPHG